MITTTTITTTSDTTVQTLGRHIVNHITHTRSCNIEIWCPMAEMLRLRLHSCADVSSHNTECYITRLCIISEMLHCNLLFSTVRALHACGHVSCSGYLQQSVSRCFIRCRPCTSCRLASATATFDCCRTNCWQSHIYQPDTSPHGNVFSEQSHRPTYREI